MKKNLMVSWRSILIVFAALALFWQLGVAVALYVDHNWSAIRFEYPVDYGEGPLLD